jgi:hypothetical protein
LHVILVIRQRMNEHTPQARTIIQTAMNSSQQKREVQLPYKYIHIYAHTTKSLCIYLDTKAT